MDWATFKDLPADLNEYAMVSTDCIKKCVGERALKKILNLPNQKP